MSNISFLIADDHALIRQTWDILLSTHSRYQVIGESSTGEQAVALAGQLRPDIVIMDINMPDVDGLEATRRIRLCAPATRVIGVSAHTQPAFARRMLQSGAWGYVTKSSSTKEFFAAIAAVLQGTRYFCEEIKNSITEQALSGEDLPAPVQSLTPRELEIIGLIKEGLPSVQISKRLFVSVKTVEVHRYNILKKLKLKNTAALVNYIHRHQVC